MDAETQSQLTDLTQLRTTHERRRHQLRLQAATAGRNAPPEIRVELEDLDATIVSIETQITKLHISANQEHYARQLAPEIENGQEPTLNVLIERQAAQGRYIQHVEDSLRTELTGIYRLLLDRADVDDASRTGRQHWLDTAIKIIIGLLIALLVIAGAISYAVIVRG